MSRAGTIARAVGLGGPARRARVWWEERRPLTAVERRGRLDDEHFRLLASYLLAADSAYIDVGAGEGDLLAHAVAYAPRGRHIAYEPLAGQARRIAERFPDVEVRCAALSDESGDASFVHVRNMPAYSGLRRRPYPGAPDIETITVRTERLDDSLPEDYVPALIKIDVEGAEVQVIRGAMQTIEQHRPVIVFEHGEDSSGAYGSSSADLWHLVCDDLGMRIFDMDGNGPLDLTSFRRANGRVWNFVAHR